MKADNYFIYTGNAYPHKNLSRLIEAVVLLNAKNNHIVKLKIVSSRNIFTQRLVKTIKKLKANGFIELLGFVDDQKLSKLYKNSIAFVFPSLSEGFGLPGIEAIRAGTLLLASDIPVFKEVYDGHAMYFDPLDSLSIEKSMETAVNLSQQERKLQIDNAYNFVKRYSWAKMARETLKIYEKAGSTSI